jgi:hypothetical protein
MFVVTSCMAGAVVNQAGINNHLHHFLNKRALDCPTCCDRRYDPTYGCDDDRFYDRYGSCGFGVVSGGDYVAYPGGGRCSDCPFCLPTTTTSTRPTTTTTTSRPTTTTTTSAPTPASTTGTTSTTITTSTPNYCPTANAANCADGCRGDLVCRRRCRCSQ